MKLFRNLKEGIDYTFDVDTAGNGCYVYVLANNRCTGKPICTSWDTPEEVKKCKCFIAQGVRMYRRSAGILVYRLATLTETGEKEWLFYESCEVPAGWVFQKTQDYKSFIKM